MIVNVASFCNITPLLLAENLSKIYTSVSEIYYSPRINFEVIILQSAMRRNRFLCYRGNKSKALRNASAPLYIVTEADSVRLCFKGSLFSSFCWADNSNERPRSLSRRYYEILRSLFNLLVMHCDPFKYV